MNYTSSTNARALQHVSIASRTTFSVWCDIASHLQEAGACGTRNDGCTGQRGANCLALARHLRNRQTGKKSAQTRLRHQQISALLTLMMPLAVCSAVQL